MKKFIEKVRTFCVDHVEEIMIGFYTGFAIIVTGMSCSALHQYIKQTKLQNQILEKAMKEV